ncbi:right-handed parallel beta-helix repeat-containing protein [Nonomuraea sp. NPDC059007]|uniref:right-handed parallel beta-helix repeat-containing protein n=1 Tax=Nonomuraea sp. NPDC059007 TaxID=3346692 RepID=UPI0036CD6F14
MIFVDPSGDDSGPGTIERPFATLERARAAGGVITLRAGVHRLTETLRLTEADSGIVLQAHGYGTAVPEKVVVSGGTPITGWQEGDGGVWRATAPATPVRQLYVGGRRAERASLSLAETAITATETGYVLEQAVDWPGAVEFVYRGAYPWSEARIPVASIAGTSITMAQPAFGWARKLYHSIITWEGGGEHYAVDAPTAAENSPAFLTPGTFAVSDGVLHYLPLPGESLDDVVAPVLETLVHAGGVRGAAFRGITFAEAAWTRPSGQEGFLHYHGNGFYAGGDLQVVTFDGGQVTVPGDPADIPGNVVVDGASDVRVEGCRFTRLGGVALEFRGAGARNVLLGSEIDEVAGGGVVIRDGAREHRIERTRLRRVGLDYHGSPAILIAGTESTVVARNDVGEVPHNGIVVNAGRGTQVLGNLIHDTMQVLADGGGLYVSGPQGSSYASGALIRGNVIKDTITPYNYGLYTDYGAAWVTVQGNVVHRADNPVVLEVSPPLEHVAFIGNFWDADPGQPPKSVTLSDNTVLGEGALESDPAVADIVAGAGI